MGCDFVPCRLLYGGWHFNPRTHVGCDGGKSPPIKSKYISIHAPTWGATIKPPYPSKAFVFQSTHPRGVRLYIFGIFQLTTKFQSTHPRGVRLRFVSSFVESISISIHAPTWGATFLLPLRHYLGVFQSTHPRGVRLIYLLCRQLFAEFQSTHPRGVRQFAPNLFQS